MKKIYVFLLITGLLLIICMLLLFMKNFESFDERKEDNELKKYNMPLLSPDDFEQNNDFFNQSLFNVFTITKLNREIYDITSADFNNDGYLDIAITGSHNFSKIFILFYHGNWNFTYNMIYLFENDISGLVAGDFDNDGDDDLIFTSGENIRVNGTYYRINGTTNFLINDGNLNFSRRLISKRSTGNIRDEEGRINPRITSADYDNDGDLDLLVGDNSGKVEMFINNGSGNFTSAGIIHDFGSKSWGLTSADYDNDGDIDFIVSAHEKGNISRGHLYLKKNQIIESNYSTCFLSGYGKHIANVSFIPAVASLSSFDFENDGDIDIIVGTRMILYILINEGENFRSIPVGYSKKHLPSEIETLHIAGFTCFDFNDDGLIDFALGTCQGYLRLFLNKGSYNSDQGL